MGRVLSLILLVACSSVEYRAADLQLDLPGPLPEGAEQVRLCVDGVGTETFGARESGRFALTGLPAGQAIDVVVDVVGEDELLAQARVSELGGWSVGELEDCAPDSGMVPCQPCSARGQWAEKGEDSWVLALRFTD